MEGDYARGPGRSERQAGGWWGSLRETPDGAARNGGRATRTPERIVKAFWCCGGENLAGQLFPALSGCANRSACFCKV